MNLSRCVCLSLKPRKVKPFSHMLLSRRFPSTAASEIVLDPKFDEEILNTQPRVQRRKPAIEPFAKNLFMSILNTDIMAFPEILDKEEITALENRVSNIKNAISGNQSDEEVRTVLLNNRIYGAPASVFHGGLASNCTEKLRILEEVAKYRSQIAMEISGHWAGMEALQFAYAESDLDRVMPDLVSGRFAVRICASEIPAEAVDVPDLRTTAKCVGHGNWLINGEKLTDAVTLTGEEGEFMVVFGAVRFDVAQAFLVQPGAPGITRHGGVLAFHDTPATILGVDMLQALIELGPLRGDQELPVSPLQSSLTAARLNTSAICVGLLKAAIATTAQNIAGRFVAGKPLSEHLLLRDRVADAVTVLYKSESMLYLTAGLNDGYENPDVELEALLCRIYATREAARAIHALLEFLKPKCLEGDLEGLAAAARELLVCGGQNDSLSVYAGLLGVQHAGHYMSQDVDKMRNPMFHPVYIMRRMLDTWRQRTGRVPMTLGLYEYLHPSLRPGAEGLEPAVLSVYHATEQVLARHGADVALQHRDVNRLVNLVIEVFSMTASISRASRAYCIGLRGGEREMYQALLVCNEGKRAAKVLVERVEDGPYLSGDRILDDLARDALAAREADVEHCLTRVFF